MKLWYFRTPVGAYIAAKYKPKQGDFALLDCGYCHGSEMLFGRRKPRGMPKLAPGECIPVDLRPAEGKP